MSAASHTRGSSLLELRDVQVRLATAAGEIRPVDGVSLTLEAGKTLGLVGESGCGKTMTALSIMRLLPPAGRIVGGNILFAGRDLLALPEATMRSLRGDEIAMIFQEPTTSLNPVLTVGSQIAEAVRVHRKASRRGARATAVEMLRLVEISEPERRSRQYPHELSGGMRQRVMIGIALSCRPRVLIADEPTTALDVTIQAQILDLLSHLQKRLGMAVLLVAHDLGIVAERADRVAVMYAGRVVEQGEVAEVFRRPLHPYTKGLLQSMPASGAPQRRRLATIPGAVPNLCDLPTGCRFRTRCPIVAAACSDTEPGLERVGADHLVACTRGGGEDRVTPGNGRNDA